METSPYHDRASTMLYGQNRILRIIATVPGSLTYHKPSDRKSWNLLSSLQSTLRHLAIVQLRRRWAKSNRALRFLMEINSFLAAWRPNRLNWFRQRFTVRELIVDNRRRKISSRIPVAGCWRSLVESLQAILSTWGDVFWGRPTFGAIATLPLCLNLVRIQPIVDFLTPQREAMSTLDMPAKCSSTIRPLVSSVTYLPGILQKMIKNGSHFKFETRAIPENICENKNLCYKWKLQDFCPQEKWAFFSQSCWVF